MTLLQRILKWRENLVSVQMMVWMKVRPWVDNSVGLMVLQLVAQMVAQLVVMLVVQKVLQWGMSTVVSTVR